MEQRLLYIAGAMHSGSTALSLYLDRHPMMVAVSQPEWLGEYGDEGEASPCTCGRPLGSCPFWQRVNVAFAELTGEQPDPHFANAYVQTASSFRLGPARALLHYSLLAGGSVQL